MNVPQLTAEELADAREETYHALNAVAHYCRCACAHLEYADDPVTLYDLTTAREYFASAIRSFSPIRAAIKTGIADREGGP